MLAAFSVRITARWSERSALLLKVGFSFICRRVRAYFGVRYLCAASYKQDWLNMGLSNPRSFNNEFQHFLIRTSFVSSMDKLGRKPIVRLIFFLSSWNSNRTVGFILSRMRFLRCGSLCLGYTRRPHPFFLWEVKPHL